MRTAAESLVKHLLDPEYEAAVILAKEERRKRLEMDGLSDEEKEKLMLRRAKGRRNWKAFYKRWNGGPSQREDDPPDAHDKTATADMPRDEFKTNGKKWSPKIINSPDFDDYFVANDSDENAS